jgi:hypothetical protein
MPHTYTVHFRDEAAVAKNITWTQLCKLTQDQQLASKRGRSPWYTRDDGLILTAGGHRVIVFDTQGEPTSTRPYDHAKDGAK